MFHVLKIGYKKKNAAHVQPIRLTCADTTYWFGVAKLLNNSANNMKNGRIYGKSTIFKGKYRVNLLQAKHDIPDI